MEVPLHLLRYVCLFCGKQGLSLMKECFESGSPDSLPFPIAHAFITIVSNVSRRRRARRRRGCSGWLNAACVPQIRIWLHIPAVMQHIIPFRTHVIR